MTFILVLFGGFINRIRGGWFDIGKFKKPINHILFGIIFGHSLFQMIVLGCSMWLGICFGWGSYIDGLINKKVQPRGDSKILDYLFLRGTNYPVLRNALALNLRGLLWSSCLAIGFYLSQNKTCYIIVFSGLMMGFIYTLSCQIGEKLLFRGNGWQIGEFLFGTYLWLICYFSTCL